MIDKLIQEIHNFKIDNSIIENNDIRIYIHPFIKRLLQNEIDQLVDNGIPTQIMGITIVDGYEFNIVISTPYLPGIEHVRIGLITNEELTPKG